MTVVGRSPDMRPAACAAKPSHADAQHPTPEGHEGDAFVHTA